MIKDIRLAHHGTNPCHLKEQPLKRRGALPFVIGQELSEFFGELDQYGARFGHREIIVIVIHDGRYSTVWVELDIPVFFLPCSHSPALLA